MSDKDVKVVVFTTNNARILINPPDLLPFVQMPNAVIDPDLSSVVGVAPHHWKLTNGKIQSMRDYEITARDAHIKNNGVDSHIRLLVSNPPKPSFLRRQYAIGQFLGLYLITQAAILMLYLTLRS